MRTFIAIELPDDLKQEIARVQELLRAAGASANWTRPEGIHLTLKFLGEVPDAKAQEILQAWALETGIAGPTDRLVITAGIPVGVSGTTNLVKVLELSGHLESAEDE